ncbi:MAG: FtsX-like permease family protein [Bacteroidota bacterium]
MDRKSPPKFPLSFFRWFCNPEYVEDIEGDLQERFKKRAHEKKPARWLFALDVFKLFRPGIIRKLKRTQKPGYSILLKHYFKITLRNFRKHRSYSLINAVGLAISLACCVLIGIYLNYELSYDKHFKNADRIYRLTREFKNADGSTSLHLSRLAPPFVPYLREDFPEMEVITSFNTFGTTLHINGKNYLQQNIAFADHNFFKIFQLDFISGDPLTALKNPGAMVLTEQTAVKYFGTTDVVGKIFPYESDLFLNITGVIKDMPENSHFRLEMILDFSFVEDRYSSREKMLQDWPANIYSTYFLLKNGSSIEEIEKRFSKFFTDHLDENANDRTALHIQRLTDIHLHSNLDDEQGLNGDIAHVHSFIIIGLLILIISMINYMNLTIAMSLNRAKEVGMRKVLGAGKPGIVGQFITESTVMVLLSIVSAFIIALLALPYLTGFTGNSYFFGFTEMIQSLAFIGAVGMTIGLLSGSYPALVMANFHPLNALKSRLSIGSGNSYFKQALVIVQFSISSILILCTGVVFEQLSFIKNKNLGFDKEHMLILYLNGASGSDEEAFKQSLLDHSSILNYGTSNNIPSTQLTSMSGVKTEVDGEMVSPEADIKNIRIDENFLETYGIQMAAGRYFNKNIRTDSAGYILNEAAVRMIGWASNEEAISKRMDYDRKPGRIIGVIEDIHFESLESKITPMIFLLAEDPLYVLSARLNSGDLTETLSYIENQWNSFFPKVPIEYQFLDERFNALYEAETKRAEIFTGLSCIAIFIASLGLFGLASFTVSRRTREVGIRKVLGASIKQILVLLSKEFMILVGISFIVGFPIAFYFTEQWLNSYAYRINISFLPFLLTCVICLGMALVAVSLRTIEAAKHNPVKSLKYE